MHSTEGRDQHRQTVLQLLRDAFEVHVQGDHGRDALVYSFATHQAFIELITRHEEALARMRERVERIEAANRSERP